MEIGVFPSDSYGPLERPEAVQATVEKLPIRVLGSCLVGRISVMTELNRSFVNRGRGIKAVCCLVEK